MGCLKLTYREENELPNWQVWVAESGVKETKGCLVAQNGRASTQITGAPYTAGKQLRLGIIGFGIRGEQILRAAGYATPDWKRKMERAAADNPKNHQLEDHKNQESLNIVINGVCDLFDNRALSAAEAGGASAGRYKNYLDLLASKNIDAVIIATPDHWHAKMILDAVKAGKHVYSEKCLTRTAQEAVEVLDKVSASKLKFQLGHQLRQTASYHAAKEVISRDMMGHISLIQTNSNRNSKNGAWVYDFHPDANANSIDWNQFEIENKQQPFSLDRFFRWRKYWDYSTGLFGDLLTHDFDAINQIMALGIPETVMSSGGNYYWKDGREVPDVLQVMMEYPEKGLTYSYSATQANQWKRPNIIMGSDATMELGSTMSVYPDRNSELYAEKLKSGKLNPNKKMFAYNSNNSEFDGVSSATQKYFAEKGMMFTDVDGKRINPTYLHLREWLDCIRNDEEPSCNIDQAFEEAIATHMSVTSYREQRMVRWDKKNRRMV